MSNESHYEKAEELLVLANQRVSTEWPNATGETKADIIAEANVHALLAIVDRLEGR